MSGGKGISSGAYAPPSPCAGKAIWMTVGEFFRHKGMDFPVESFKVKLRELKPEHLEGTRPWKYRVADLEAAYQEMCKNSLCMRKKTML